MTVRRIYVASSWRNAEYPSVVEAIRGAGHELYDFRNPPRGAGFGWEQLDGGWLSWSIPDYLKALRHPVAQQGFASDKGALDWCDTLVLVMPCGRSAHLEAGYASGQGKTVIVLLREDKFEPELMYLLLTRCVTSVPELLEALT
jgi:hypothetical protein